MGLVNQIGLAVALAFCGVKTLPGLDFSFQVVDGQGRPVSGVVLRVECSEPNAAPIRAETDHQGVARGTYDVAVCEPVIVSLAKEGYEAYGSGFRQRYVLRRKLDRGAELARILKLDDSIQLEGLREILSSDASRNREALTDGIFYHEARLRAKLLTLAQEPMVAEAARNFLAMIAVPEDVRFIMDLPTPTGSRAFEERWRYAVATALVGSTDSGAEKFLRRCALNQYGDRWVDAGAIQTLMLTGTATSRKILEEARRQNTFQTARIDRALAYLDSAPAPLSGGDLPLLAERVADAIRIGKWQGNSPPRFNAAGDKALVQLTFQTGSDRLGYEATLHKVDRMWTLRAARQTHQAFAPMITAPIRKP